MSLGLKHVEAMGEFWLPLKTSEEPPGHQSLAPVGLWGGEGEKNHRFQISVIFFIHQGSGNGLLWMMWTVCIINLNVFFVYMDGWGCMWSMTFPIYPSVVYILIKVGNHCFK